MARRTSFWVDTLVNANVTPATNIVQSLMGTIDTDEAASSGLTVARLILCYDLLQSVPYAAEGYQQIDLGIGVASKEAVDLGITALSDPEVAVEHPQRGWLYRCRYKVLGASAARPEGGMPVVHEYRDLRAKRKIERGILFLVVNSSDDIGSSITVNLTGIIRTLFLVS